jgi:PAS domain S-box-containing protein
MAIAGTGFARRSARARSARTVVILLLGLGVATSLALTVWPASSLRADETTRRVLVLYPYNYTFPATTAAADGARKRLFERSPQKIELDAEYLDLVRFSEPGHEALMANFLRDRYAHRQPHALLVVGGDALPFVIKHRNAFAPRVPVVFLGTSRETLASVRPPPDVTGHIVELDPNLNETLALAERLQPKARRLYVIAGSSPLDRRWQEVARKVIAGRERKFETTWLFELTYNALIAEISRIPKDAIVVTLSVFRDGAGKTFVPAELAAKLAAISPAPLYSPYFNQLDFNQSGSGHVGGFSETFESMGSTAADILLEILAGKDPATVPPRTNTERAYGVDYRAMQRWNLSESNLPLGTIVKFKEPSIWDQHRNLVLAALGVFALQTAVAGALLIQRHRRRAAEKLLAESEERMTFTAASMNVGMWQFDRKTNELWATEHSRALFGLASDVPLTRDTVLKAIHPDDRERIIASLRGANSGNRMESSDFRIVLPDGQIRWVRARVRAHRDEQGGSGNLSGVFVDVTEQKAAETEAELQRQEIAHLTRVSALGELSGAIAHEINQPLTAILSNAQAAIHLLSRQPPDLDEVRDALTDIVQEDNRAGEVIQRLRNLLKKGDEKFEPVNANDLVQSTLTLLHTELIRRQVAVDTDLADWLPPLLGDTIQVQQVLLNLILNAADAMAATPVKRRIAIISTRAGRAGNIEISVRDHGCGLEPEAQSRVFKPFFTTKDHGLGLGLAICARIVGAHGGTLTLKNHDTGGAIAIVSLPAQAFAVAAQ